MAVIGHLRGTPARPAGERSRFSVALTRLECEDLLASRYTGRLGYVVDGEPRIVAVNYRWRQNAIYVRSRPGEKLDAASAPDAVLALQIDEVDDTYHRGWSVLVVGPATVVEGDPGPGLLLRPWPGETDSDRWIVIQTRQITGRAV